MFKDHQAEWFAWKRMIYRCQNRTDVGYHNYGGRGIRVCERWDGDFNQFLRDMGKRPSPKHSIDRIDNDGNYEPGNCRWATRKEQQRNRRNKVVLTYKGESLCIGEWSEKLGIPFQLLWNRKRRGWNDSQIIEGASPSAITFRDKTMRMSQWSRVLGIKRNVLSARIFMLGWSVEKAFTTPVRLRRRLGLVKWKGEAKTISQWAATTGIPYLVLHARLTHLKWTPAKALSTPKGSRKRKK